MGGEQSNRYLYDWNAIGEALFGGTTTSEEGTFIGGVDGWKSALGSEMVTSAVDVQTYFSSIVHVSGLA